MESKGYSLRKRPFGMDDFEVCECCGDYAGRPAYVNDEDDEKAYCCLECADANYYGDADLGIAPLPRDERREFER